LGAMFLFSLLPVGLLELVESYRTGIWLAKSSQFFDRPVIQLLGQIRIVPDTVIILLGAIPLLIFYVISLRHLKPVEVREDQVIFREEEALPL